MEIIQDNSAMIDEKDEVSSKYEKTTNSTNKSKTSKNYQNTFVSSPFSNIENKIKTPSIHQKKITKITSNLYDKENDQ